MIFLSLISIVDWLLFVLSAFSVVYLAVFAFASLFALKLLPVSKNDMNKILILIPAYKEDKVIFDSVNSMLRQNYPRQLFDISVISDQMNLVTIEKLRAREIQLFVVNYPNSSKAKALNYAFTNICREYDIAVILDADNTVNEDFLGEINNAYNYGFKAIQAHRKAKNLNTETAYLDAISEEINNSIFRKGHTNIGLPSALIGSGMAIDFKWLKSNIAKLESAGEDKELEVLLLKDRLHIAYLESVPVFDEKTQQSSGFYNQRRRWIAAQIDILSKAIADLPMAIINRNFGYADKLIQWMLLPRLVLIGFIFFMSSLWTIFNVFYSVKWWILLLLLITVLAVAIPRYLLTKRFLIALKKIPLLFVLMTANFFRLKGVNKQFIHTKKG